MVDADSARTVLVVEDEASLKEILVYFLEGEGFTVASTASGTEALAYVRRHRPPAVLLDIALPGLSGDAVCREIRADPRLAHCFVVMMSALPDAEAHRLARDSRADLCLIKPLDLGAVAELLRPRVTEARGERARVAPAACAKLLPRPV